jgi:hypothetical protein
MGKPKTIDLSEIPGYESGAREFIVEDRKTNDVKVISRDGLTKLKPEQVGTVIPRPFQTDIVDGADIAEIYLHKEFGLMKKFFQERGILKPKVTYDFTDPKERWFKVDFPLPKTARRKNGTLYRYPYDKEAIVFVLNNYPDNPPIGFFVPKMSRNIEVFQEIFQTHLFNEALLEAEHVRSALQKDWYWICFHYKDNRWRFNRNDLKEGDSLTYFMYYIYYKMKGVPGVSNE